MSYFRTYVPPDIGMGRRRVLSNDEYKLYQLYTGIALEEGDEFDFNLARSMFLGSDAGFLGMFRIYEDREKLKWKFIEDTLIMHLNNFQRINCVAKGIQFSNPSEVQLSNPRNEYWRIKNYHSKTTTQTRRFQDINYHPLITNDETAFDRNSEMALLELDFEFDLLKNNNDVFLRSAVYFGNDLNFYDHFYRNSSPSVDLYPYDFDYESWSDLFLKSGQNHKMFTTYVEHLKRVRSLGPIDAVICDFSIKGRSLISEELENSYFLFKQMYHSFEVLEEGGKMIVRVPSMFHEVTRQIMSVFSVHFEKVKMIKPICVSVGNEDVYVCFSGKKYFRDNIESILFLASINMYFDDFNKMNALERNSQSLVVANIFSDRENLNLKVELDYFERMFMTVKEFMRNEFINLIAFKDKRREVSIVERKILTDRFNTYLDTYDGYKKEFAVESEEDYRIPADELLVVENYLENFKDTEELEQIVSDDDVAISVMKNLVDSKCVLTDFPRKEILTNKGRLKDLMTLANRVAYDKGDVKDRTLDFDDLSNYHNMCKRLLISELTFMKVVIDLACGKGVDVQKYSSGNSHVVDYRAIDISIKQLKKFHDRDFMVRFPFILYHGDFTQPKLLEGLAGKCLIAAFNVFSLLCTSKATLTDWLGYNLRYRDMLLVGSFLKPSVKENDEYIRRFSCKFNGNLMSYSVPGLVRDAYEYVVSPDEIRNVARDANVKCIFFGHEKFKKLFDESTLTTQTLVKDLTYVVMYKNDSLDDGNLRNFIANVSNTNYNIKDRRF